MRSRLLVSHQYWRQEGQCTTLRVSARELPLPTTPGGESSGSWQTVYESQPSLKVLPGYDDIETGGRLALTPKGRLLVTVGDHGFDGRLGAPLAQDMGGDYGKVIQVNGEGGPGVFTLGHRNPQGLTVARDGRIWLTEHGPEGGDELNLLKQGENYGRPSATYGTDYGLTYWPLARGAHDHGVFSEPAMVFVPSVAISNLIEVVGSAFEGREGDLLVGGLRSESVFRVRVRGDRAMYAEPIWLGRRVRDLAQGVDGRIALWVDRGEILVLEPADHVPTGATIIARCNGCHEPGPGGQPAIAPPLQGVMGRDVAGVSGYAYSNVFRALGGTWTRERLDAFLADPGRFAPGSAMVGRGVPNAVERHSLIEYLRTLVR